MVDTKQISLLYVDDEEINLLLFERSFDSLYRIYTASSGQDGLDVLGNHSDEIIVVISDMRMPRMNGVEFVKRARENYQNVAYFILTGFDYNDEIDDAIKNRVIHRFFTKPFNVVEIRKAIDEAIDELGLLN